MREMRVGPQDRVSLRAALDHPGGRRESRLVMLVFGLRTPKTSVGAPACGDILPCHSVSLASVAEVWCSLLLLTCPLYLLPPSEWLCGLQKAPQLAKLLGLKTDLQLRTPEASPLCRLWHQGSTEATTGGGLGGTGSLRIPVGSPGSPPRALLFRRRWGRR